jgi:hypothetical protein
MKRGFFPENERLLRMRAKATEGNLKQPFRRTEATVKQ